MYEIPNDFRLIGLHTLVAGRDGDAVPELLEYHLHRGAQVQREACFVQFPRHAPGKTSVKSAGNDNVILLQPYLQARIRR